jgi:hypothetical protein
MIAPETRSLAYAELVPFFTSPTVKERYVAITCATGSRRRYSAPNLAPLLFLGM